MFERVDQAPTDFLPWIATLAHEHRTELIGYARKRGLGTEDALDAVQDTFLAFLERPDARRIARVGPDARKFLTVMLGNHVRNRRRKVDRQARGLKRLAGELDTESESSDELIARAEEFTRVSGCILRLARLQQAVVRLSLVDERPHDEIAKTLGISAVHARVLLHRAREHVRNCSYDEPVPAVAPARPRRARKTAARARRAPRHA